MTIICEFENIQEMARAVAESVNGIEKRKYTLRPWNRFDPEDSLWWLVPSTEWPAYAHGKGVISPGDSLSPEQIFCGLHVEKGVDPTAAQVYPELRRRNLLLESHWTWHRFLEGFQNGAVVRVGDTVSLQSGAPVVIEVAAWYSASLEDFDPYNAGDNGENEECRSPIDGGQVWFEVAGDQLKKLRTFCLQDVTRPVSACRSLPDLAQVFQQTRDMTWSWIDFSIGTMVWLEKNSPEPGQYWDANDIWDKLIRPWQPWMVRLQA